MRWVIKNPAPLDSRLEKWGDFHFGRLLAKQLEKRNHSVVSHYDGEWESRAGEPADVVLLLRGKYPLSDAARHAGATHVLWNISHPAAVTLDECDFFDVIGVASEAWADRLGSKLGRRVWPLLQCTDPDEFFDRNEGDIAKRCGAAFVGNTRDFERPIVRWAIDAGVPLEIYGRGWGKFGLTDRVVADYIPNDRLGEFYSSLSFTLNEHHEDMREFGFINNRVFDSLACGLPLISDHHHDLKRLFPDEVLLCGDPASFQIALRKMMVGYGEIFHVVRACVPRIRREFSFQTRCGQLLDVIQSGGG